MQKNNKIRGARVMFASLSIRGQYKIMHQQSLFLKNNHVSRYIISSSSVNLYSPSKNL